MRLATTGVSVNLVSPGKGLESPAEQRETGSIEDRNVRKLVSMVSSLLREAGFTLQ